MSAALLTGAAGFVAGRLLDQLAARGTCVSGLERIPQDPHRPLPCAAWYAGDVTDQAVVRAAVEDSVARFGPPTNVFHMAAKASVADSFKNPGRTYHVNVVGTAVLLEVLAEFAPGARVLIPSSAHVYGPPTRADGVLDEQSPLAPDTHYGASKVAQEMVGRLFHERRGLPVYLTRAFNHVGSGQGPGFVFSDFARRLAELERAGGGVISVGNLEAQRDFLDVRDVVAAYFMVLERGEPGLVYNVASGEPWSMRAILDLFLAEARVEVKVRPDPALLRPSDVPVLVGAADRLRTLGWAPHYDIRDTVRGTLDYWRQRLAP
jgi:GDP-4-dehydro-6-deoxy-D-mannose reductase